MKTMEAGFNAIVEEQKNLKNKLDILEQELKNETRASYQAQTKEGKSRYIFEKNKQGKSTKEIADQLDLTENYIKKHIRQAKRNGK